MPLVRNRSEVPHRYYDYGEKGPMSSGLPVKSGTYPTP